MRRVVFVPLAAIALIVAFVSAAHAQSGTTRTGLSGTVADSGGGILPGATVELKDNRTGVKTTVLTNSTGTFDIQVTSFLVASRLAESLNTFAEHSVGSVIVRMLQGLSRRLVPTPCEWTS